MEIGIQPALWHCGEETEAQGPRDRATSESRSPDPQSLYTVSDIRTKLAHAWSDFCFYVVIGGTGW